MVLKNLNVPYANLLTACSTHDHYPVHGALSLCPCCNGFLFFTRIQKTFDLRNLSTTDAKLRAQEHKRLNKPMLT
jgi:hypothetical protein